MGLFNIGFHLISCLLALLAAALLLWVNRERRHSNRLLAFVLIFFAFQNLIFVLLFTHLILKIPGLLRVFGPTTFLLGPAVYIYIRSVLQNELRFRKYDWLLLIPAFLAFVNFIPFYLLPASEKIDYLNQNFYNKAFGQDTGRGIIPTMAYLVIRSCWSGFFLAMGFRLMYCFMRNNTHELVARNKIMLNWLVVFNSLLAAILLISISKLFIPTVRDMHFSVGDILLGATILFICVQLFFRPQILYGIFRPSGAGDTLEESLIAEKRPLPDSILNEKMDIVDDNDTGASVISISESDAYRYNRKLEMFFRDKKPYLNPAYSLDLLVTDLGIPRYVLSSLINKEYGMGFREFLNRYRVRYMLENLKKPEWKQFTLEAIATECGFSSRSSFIKNFKLITGQTPSEYAKGGMFALSNSA